MSAEKFKSLFFMIKMIMWNKKNLKELKIEAAVNLINLVLTFLEWINPNPTLKS